MWRFYCAFSFCNKVGAKFSTYKSGVPFSFQVNEFTSLPKVLQHTKTTHQVLWVIEDDNSYRACNLLMSKIQIDAQI